mmetsp:Transcript_8333/g.10970  ORF Transcript_8333/g.10970 Transcript_8333/m.10970 type:complete len:120 (+) Transcript_8333:3-362(+)
MGLASPGSNQFWSRITMFFMQPSMYPAEPYTQYMETKKMHGYTVIQLSLFAILYAVKSTKTIAIAFPIVIAACIPIRLFVLPKLFTEGELIVIDGEDHEIKQWIEKKDMNKKNQESDSC